MLLANCRYWSDLIWPQHDTLGAFESFYFFYNDLFFFGELPRWKPFEVFGIPSLPDQSIALSPASYLAMAVGFLFRIQNALFLFKLGIFFDQLVLLIGTYLLSGILFEQRITRFFVTLGVVLSGVWHIQVNQNFRIYCLLPLALYYLLSFFLRRRAHHFWISAFVFLISLVGSIVYYAPLHLLVAIVVTVVLFLTRGGAPLPVPFDRSKKTILSFLAFCLLALSSLYVWMDAGRNLAIRFAHRDPTTLKSSIENFLTYGGSTVFGKFLGILYAGPVDLNIYNGQFLADHTIYLGILPLLFIFYALKNVKRPLFGVFGLIAILFVSFSLADTSFVARLTYHLVPMMSYYRHIGLVSALIRLFLLLCAGFGLDQYLKDVMESDELSKAGFRPRRAILFYGIFLLLAIGLVDFALLTRPDVYPKIWPSFFYYNLALFGICVLLLSVRPGRSVSFIKAVTVIFLLLDLGSYQNLVFSSIPKVTAEEARTAQVHPYRFQIKRTNDIRSYGERAVRAHQISKGGKLVVGDSFYVQALSYVQMDLCDPTDFRVGFVTSGVDRLVEARNGKTLKDLKGDPLFQKLIACESPKVYLTTNATQAATLAEAQSKIKSRQDDDQSLTILRRVASGSNPSVEVKSTSPPDIGSIKFDRFTSNRLSLEANIVPEEGAWLVYADSWFPGWHAYVNNRETEIWEANLAFKSIKLEQGKSQVLFKFFDLKTEIVRGIIIVFCFAFSLWMLYLTGTLSISNLEADPHSANQ